MVEDWLDDGFGNLFAAKCQTCGAPMEIVRPGEARCSAECWMERADPDNDIPY